MDYNAIGDAGATALAEALKTNSALQHLEYVGELCSRGKVVLAWWNHFRLCSASSNKIGESGITALAEALSNNSGLTYLK